MPDQVSINLNELRNAVDAGLRTRRYLDYWRVPNGLMWPAR